MDPETTPAEDQPQTPVDPAHKPEELGPDELRAALKAAREEAAKRRVENRELRKEFDGLTAKLDGITATEKAAEDARLKEEGNWKAIAAKYETDLAQAQADIKAAKLTAMRVKVAAEFGLNVPLGSDDDGSDELLSDRLRGDTETALRQDATRLAKLFYTAVAKSEPAPDAPAPKPAPAPAGSQQTTTAVPGGQPAGRTDADRAREYLSGVKDSPIFQKGEIKLPSDLDNG